ncbi:hypothetical protein VCM_00059 [Pseudomonas phage VCM]|uniref:Uncharacterized protein n=1 Tax=Pseudomonas phage VCM TaxID=1729937 RepID=A0A0S4KZA3_9CAUD|nr:hypothetical protein VCM_00059 [Pseudomonas phage VCM]CUR44278.1 hypothetical protein VCM_00059 [Pseudomonas phage VCM]
MSWFKPKVTARHVMFDMDKLKELESFTPLQVVELVCSAFQIKPENAVLMHCDPDTYQERYPNIAHILRVHQP